MWKSSARRAIRGLWLTLLIVAISGWGMPARVISVASGSPNRVPPHHATVPIAARSAGEADPRLPRYQPTQLVVIGQIQIAGNVATVHLAEDLAEALNDQQPALQVRARSIEAARTPPWWRIADQPTVALLSERMTDDEVAAFERQWGYKPTGLRVAMNAAVVVVHSMNPIARRGLTLPELDAIFSQTRFRGHADIRRWSDLGLGGEWAQRPITLYGHDASTNLFVHFRRKVLENGDFKPGIVRQPGSAVVVHTVGRDVNAIGYTGYTFVTDAVAVVPLAANPTRSFVAPTPESILSQRYPLAHFVYLYLNQKPGHSLDISRLELIRFVYSRQGQQLMADRGYVPIPAVVATQELQQLDITLSHHEP